MDYVRLDVGGQLFTTSKQTLNRYPDTFLATLVSPEHDKRETELDFIPIDRDGKHFGAVLTFLRDSLDLSDWSSTDLTELAGEADFYGLTELKSRIDTQLEVLYGKDELADLLPEECFIGFFSRQALLRHLRGREQVAKVIKFRDGHTDVTRVVRRLGEIHNLLQRGCCKYILFENRELREIGVCDNCERQVCSTDCSSSRMVHPKSGLYQILDFAPGQNQGLTEVQSFATSSQENNQGDRVPPRPQNTHSDNRSNLGRGLGGSRNSLNKVY